MFILERVDPVPVRDWAMISMRSSAVKHLLCRRICDMCLKIPSVIQSYVCPTPTGRNACLILRNSQRFTKQCHSTIMILFLYLPDTLSVKV